MTFPVLLILGGFYLHTIPATIVLPDNIISEVKSSTVERFAVDKMNGRCNHEKIIQKWVEAKLMLRHSRKIVWTCREQDICGGNADRIRGITISFLHALRLGYSLVLDWNNPINNSRLFVPRRPDLWTTVAATSYLNNNRTLRIKSIDNRNLLYECQWTKYENIILQSNAFIFRNCERNETKPSDYFSVESSIKWRRERFMLLPCLGCVFWFLFALSDDLQSTLIGELKLFNEWLLLHSRIDIPVIAVHFRGGDHYMDVPIQTINEGDKRLQLSNVHSLISCADKLANRSATILLVADNNLVKRFALRNYPDRVYSSTVNPFHTDRVGIASINGTLGTWADLLLLSLCDGIVLSHSGFGALAAQIGMYDESQIKKHDDCLPDVKFHPMDIKGRILFKNI